MRASLRRKSSCCQAITVEVLRTMKRKTLRLLFVAAATALGLCRVANSDLRVDLRVTSVSGPATMNNPQSVLITAPGALINMDIIACVTGTNAFTHDDSLVSLTG